MVKVGNGNTQGHGAGGQGLALRTRRAHRLKESLRVSACGGEDDGGDTADRDCKEKMANTTRDHDLTSNQID